MIEIEGEIVKQIQTSENVRDNIQLEKVKQRTLLREDRASETQMQRVVVWQAQEEIHRDPMLLLTKQIYKFKGMEGIRGNI